MKNFRVLALTALFPLAACGGGSSTAGGKPPPPFFCPNPAVVEQAQTITLFLPERQDVAARISTAQITIPSASCVLKKKKGTVMMTINASFMADNGPANNFKPITLTWFAAITDGTKIIQKTDYTRTFKFNGNVSSVSGDAKPIKVEFPSDPTTENMQVLIGFEMTPAQLAYAAAHPNAAP